MTKCFKELPIPPSVEQKVLNQKFLPMAEIFGLEFNFSG